MKSITQLLFSLVLYSRSKDYMFRPVVAFIRSLSFDKFKSIWFSVVLVLQASACKTSTTENQPHQISNTQRTENKTNDVVIQ